MITYFQKLVCLFPSFCNQAGLEAYSSLSLACLLFRTFFYLNLHSLPILCILMNIFLRNLYAYFPRFVIRLGVVSSYQVLSGLQLTLFGLSSFPNFFYLNLHSLPMNNSFKNLNAYSPHFVIRQVQSSWLIWCLSFVRPTAHSLWRVAH